LKTSKILLSAVPIPIMQKEAKARIKINDLLQKSDWRFFDDEKGRANISLEPNVKLTKTAIDSFGNNFEKTKNGFVDFLLLDKKGFPYVVLEAKSEDKELPLLTTQIWQ
jgi:type I restriction enzyme R subunit